MTSYKESILNEGNSQFLVEFETSFHTTQFHIPTIQLRKQLKNLPENSNKKHLIRLITGKIKNMRLICISFVFFIT